MSNPAVVSAPGVAGNGAPASAPSAYVPASAPAANIPGTNGAVGAQQEANVPASAAPASVPGTVGASVPGTVGGVTNVPGTIGESQIGAGGAQGVGVAESQQQPPIPRSTNGASQAAPTKGEQGKISKKEADLVKMLEGVFGPGVRVTRSADGTVSSV